MSEHTRTAGEHAAATALMKYGDYTESEDSLEWLRREAVDVARAVDQGESVVAVLIDTAFCDPDDPESLATAHAVQQELTAHVASEDAG